MLRKDMINALERVVKALEESNVLTTLHLRGESAGPEQLAQIAKSLSHYGVLASKFGSNEIALAQTMGLDLLLEPDRVVTLALKGSSANQELLPVIRSMIYTSEFLPKVVKLLGPSASVHSGGGTKGAGDRAGIIAIDLIEPSDHGSRIERIQMLLKSVDDLYKLVCEIEKIESEPLLLIACDSGSDKSFWVQGTAMAIEGVKKIIMDVWRGSIFHKEVGASMRIKSIAESLPILAGIKKLHDEANIDSETASRLHHAVVEAATHFIETGSVIPEIYNETGFSPRELLAPSRKLLVGPPTSDSSANRKPRRRTSPSPRRLIMEDED